MISFKFSEKFIVQIIIIHYWKYPSIEYIQYIYSIKGVSINTFSEGVTLRQFTAAATQSIVDTNLCSVPRRNGIRTGSLAVGGIVALSGGRTAARWDQLGTPRRIPYWAAKLVRIARGRNSVNSTTVKL